MNRGRQFENRGEERPQRRRRQQLSEDGPRLKRFHANQNDLSISDRVMPDRTRNGDVRRRDYRRPSSLSHEERQQERSPDDVRNGRDVSRRLPVDQRSRSRSNRKRLRRVHSWRQHESYNENDSFQRKRCRRDEKLDANPRFDDKLNRSKHYPKENHKESDLYVHISRKKSRSKIRKKRKKSYRKSSTSSSHSESSDSSPKRRTGVVSDDDDVDTWKVSAAPASQITNEARKSGNSVCSWDDTFGHFRGANGAVVADRYRVIREVGIGTFGRVLECLDLQRRSSYRNGSVQNRSSPYVAIKIVRNVKRYYDSALIEAGIVADMNRHGGRGLSHCVILHDSFPFNGHYCLVFESLGPSLYDFLKRHNYQPFPMVCVQDFAVQLLETLEFLHSVRLIHTDLKIENILLMNDREVRYGNSIVPESTKIKVIDFGGACYDRDKKSSIINTRQYRAPEVILGTGWSMPSDMWSAGCILSELYQGELLFPTHDNIEHLALMERIIGYFPPQMVKAAKNGTQSDIARQAFDSSGRHRMERSIDPEKYAFVRRMPRLEHIVRNPLDAWFLGLLRQILHIDPTNRATAHECLQYLSRNRKDTVLYR